MATISSLIIMEVFPACSSYCNNFIESKSSLGFSGKNFVKIPEAMIAGDLGNFISDLSLALLLPKAVSSNYISFANLYVIFLSRKLAKATL